MAPVFVSPFRNVSGLLRPNPPELNYGCAMVDLDRSGLPQILVLTVGGANRLYKWHGDMLRDVAPAILQDPQTNGIGVACADMTGNGWLDVYLLNTTAFLGPESDPDRLLGNEGQLSFRDLMEENNISNFGAGRSVIWWDHDGSGRPAAYVCNYAEPCRLFARGGDGRIRNVAPQLGLNQLTGGRAAVAADFFDTGRLDLFTGSENDQNRFYRNLGGGEFQEIAARLGLADPHHHCRGLMVCDVNRDGRPDLVWANWEGRHRLMIQQPDGTFRDEADEDFALPSRARTLIVFDYDNDGWEDIFLNNMGEPNRLFHNNGDGTFTEVDAGELALPQGLGTGATAGDLNGDGFLDLFVAHGEMMPQPNALFLNTPNGNHWLRVHARTAAGAPAIGARVTAWPEGDDRPIRRFLDGGSGYLCQMEPVAHIGLGRATRVARLEVRYSDGRTFEAEGIDADQHLLVQPAKDGWRTERLELG